MGRARGGVEARTGGPASAAVSATVCGPDLAFADAFATGLLAAGQDGFEPIVRAGYEALIVTEAGHVESTAEFTVHRTAVAAPETGLSGRSSRHP